MSNPSQALASLKTLAASLLLLMGSATLVPVAHAQSTSCKRLQPDEVRLLIRARDAAGVTSALRCRRELIADERVRGPLAYAFGYDAFSANESFVNSLRRGGLKFVVDLAPLLPEKQADNLDTPLGMALTQGNRAAVDWLLLDAKPGDLRAYRRLALPALEFLLGRSEFGPREQQLNAALQAAVARGLPVDADAHAPYFQALLTWWRTQDAIDYTDNSSGANHGPRPLPASGGPLWQQIADTLAPTDPRTRREVQLRAADSYAKYHLDSIEARVEALKGSLAGAVRRPGALVVDSMGIIDTQRYGRVPREAAEATIEKLQARAQRLRATLTAQLGTAALPAWAQAPGIQGVLGEVFGLRLGANYYALIGGREAPPPCSSSQPPATLCARAAMPPLAWQGEAKLADALNAGRRFPPGGRRFPPLETSSAVGNNAGSGIIRLELPAALRQPGLPTSVDVVVNGGRIETLLMQGGEYQLARELRRLWGDPAEAFTDWYRIREGRFYNRAVGTVALNSGEEATLTERVYSGDDDRPVARYRWQGEAGVAEMLCAMGCNLAVHAASSFVGPSSVSSNAAGTAQPRTEARAQWTRVFAEMPKPPALSDATLTCESEPLLPELDALPRLDPSRLEGMQRALGMQISQWARTHLPFEGPDGCVHRATAVRLWQAAINAAPTGRLTKQDVATWTQEVGQAWARISKPAAPR